MDSQDTAEEVGGGQLSEGQVSEAGLAVIATANEVLTEGSIATISLEDGALQDGLVATGGDTWLARSGGELLVLERFEGAQARLFSAEDWATPLADLVVGGDPYAAAFCGEELFITRAGLGSVAALRPETGEALAEIALSSALLDKALRGSPPVPAGLLEVGGRLYVALHAFEADGVTPADGAVAEIDCASREITGLWAAPGPLPTLKALPGETDRLLVKVGAYDQQGGVYTMELESGWAMPALLESEIGYGIADLELYGDAGIALLYDAEWRFSIHCIDAKGWRLSEGETVRSQLVDVAITPEGRAWIAARAAWDDPETPQGVLVYDVESCTSLTGADWFQTDLPPWRILVLDESP